MPGIIAPAVLEQIRAANDIVDVIQSVLPLKRAGANFVALCPFHREKTPSFNVNPHKQIFHCFGCHKGGDVFTFIREYENLSFMEAVRRLAERARIPLEFEQNDEARQVRFVKETLLQIHEAMTQHWQAALKDDPGARLARDYLARRGVSPEAVKLFRIGYAPEAWDDTVRWASGRKYDLALMEKAGLIIRRESGGFYDRFRGRLMFPICDEQGRVVAFSGRILAGDEKTAKYVNSPETEIFTKGRMFFGLDKSKRAILDAGFAIVCEGQLDLIACFMGGVQNIVAPQGTAFTAEHARILKRYVDEVVLCFDSDNAGQNAAVRVLDSLLGSGLAVRVATVPPPHDPDSFIKEHGAEAFRSLISGAQGFFDFYLNRLCAANDVQTDRGQMAVVRAMGEAVTKTGNQVLVDRYAQKTAIRLGVSAEATRSEFRKSGSKRPAPEPEPELEPELPAEAAAAAPSPAEFTLLKLLLDSDELIEWAAAHVDPLWIENEAVRTIVAQRLHLAAAGRPAVTDLLDSLDDPVLHHLVTSVVTGHLVEHTDGLRTRKDWTMPNPFQQVRDLTLRFRNDRIQRRVAELTRRASDPATTEAERTEFLHESLRLRAVLKQPLTPLADTD